LIATRVFFPTLFYMLSPVDFCGLTPCSSRHRSLFADVPSLFVDDGVPFSWPSLTPEAFSDSPDFEG